MVEWVRRQFRPPPGHTDERTEALRAEAMYFSWVPHIAGLSGLLLYRLLAPAQSAGTARWWDIALAVQVSFWLTAVLFGLRSQWASHAVLPLGFSLLGAVLATGCARLLLFPDPVRSVSAGLLSAPLWYLAGLWTVHSLRGRFRGDERIDSARGRAVVAGETVLAVSMLGLMLVRVAGRSDQGTLDLWLVWFLPAAIGGWLYVAWGGQSAEAYAAGRRIWPKGVAAWALIWLLAFYYLGRDWRQAALKAFWGVAGVLLFVYLTRPRDRGGDDGHGGRR